jgi:hypothetical protein
MTQSRQTGHIHRNGRAAASSRKWKLLQGYAIEAAKIPLSGSVAGFAGDIGAVLTRQDILTNL